MQTPAKFLRFHLEGWIQRGVLPQLLLMTAVLASVALIGGTVAWLATEQFASPGQAIWWGFLRLTDPGYLGDDEGTLLRSISTTITILGYVLFMGSLIAIMTQGLARTIRRLESGLSPIAMRDHVVILGWTNRTPELVHRLLGARGRLARFLERRGVKHLRIVIQSEDVGAERRQELREELGESWDEGRILLRSGSSRRPEDLERLDLGRAAVVIVPGADFELGGARFSDVRVMKTLLTLEGLLRGRARDERPAIVAELFENDKADVARSAYTGELQLVQSESVVGRLISQSIRHRRLGKLLLSLLSHREGSSFYVRNFPELAGESPAELDERFASALVLGVVRKSNGATEAILNPGSDYRLREDDLLVFAAERYEDCVHHPDSAPASSEPSAPAFRAARQEPQRVLVLGWSQKLGSILQELGECAETFEVVVLSVFPLEERERSLRRLDYDRERVSVRHVLADFTSPRDLAAIRPETFDDVVFFASSWLESSEDADARTLLGYVLLKSVLEGVEDGPEILVELLDADNANLVTTSEDVLFVSPRVLSHLLAHVALRPELNAIFEVLFRTGGAEIRLRLAEAYGFAGRSVRFSEVQRAARARGEVAIGIYLAANPPGERTHVNPPRDRDWSLGPRDEIVVLADDGE